VSEMLELSPQHLAASDNKREAFAQLASLMDNMDTRFELPVQHYLAPGLYGRRVFMPAGSCVVSRIHKYEHITVALTGRCLVVDADNQQTLVQAPAVFVTKPGMQRALWMETDCEWLTVHAADIDDAEAAKDLLTCTTFEAYEAFIAALPSPEDA